MQPSPAGSPSSPAARTERDEAGRALRALILGVALGAALVALGRRRT
ncbi:MAG: hypothetical protein U0V56_10875 [Actinomycetota bacterium]